VIVAGTHSEVGGGLKTRAFFWSNIFIITNMMQSGGKTERFWHRAVLVVSALLCLCVSDSAGPRLLPLPALSVPISIETCLLVRGACASRAPTQDRGPNAHIEMVVGSNYRVRDKHHHIQSATHAPRVSLQLQPTHLGRTTPIYAGLDFQTPSLSKPTGRAPPLFV
jgi:hypothetical protein